VHVLPLSHDSLSSSFLVWVKLEVKPHYHATHTETVYILEGKGDMLLGEQVMPVRAGELVVIPKNTVHAVRVKGKKPLKVLSIQAPYFDGKDRVFTDREW